MGNYRRIEMFFLLLLLFCGGTALTSSTKEDIVIRARRHQPGDPNWPPNCARLSATPQIAELLDCTGPKISLNRGEGTLDLSNFAQDDVDKVIHKADREFIESSIKLVKSTQVEKLKFKSYIDSYDTIILIEENQKLKELNWTFMRIDNQVNLKISGNRYLTNSSLNEIRKTMKNEAKIFMGGSYIQEFGECVAESPLPSFDDLKDCFYIYGDLKIESNTKTTSLFPSTLTEVKGCLTIVGTNLQNLDFLKSFKSKGACTKEHKISGNKNICIHPEFEDAIKNNIKGKMTITNDAKCEAECTSKYLLSSKNTKCVVVTDTLTITGMKKEHTTSHLEGIKTIRGRLVILNNEMENFDFFKNLVTVDANNTENKPAVEIKFNNNMKTFTLPAIKSIHTKDRQTAIYVDKNGEYNMTDAMRKDFKGKFGSDRVQIYVYELPTATPSGKGNETGTGPVGPSSVKDPKGKGKDDDDDGKSAIGGGAIAGIVVGIFFLLLLLVAGVVSGVIFHLIRRKKKLEKEAAIAEEMEIEAPPPVQKKPKVVKEKKNEETVEHYQSDGLLDLPFVRKRFRYVEKLPHFKELEDIWKTNTENINKDAQKREAVAPVAPPQAEKASAEGGEKKDGKGPEATQENDRNDEGNNDKCLLGLTFEREPALQKKEYFDFMDYVNPEAKVEAQGESKENGNQKDGEKKEGEKMDAKESPKKEEDKKEKEEEKKKKEGEKKEKDAKKKKEEKIEKEEKDEPKRTVAGKENDDESKPNDNMEPVEEPEGKDEKKPIVANGSLVANSKADKDKKKSEDSFPLCPVDRRNNTIKKKMKIYTNKLMVARKEADKAVENSKLYKEFLEECKNIGEADFENIMKTTPKADDLKESDNTFLVNPNRKRRHRAVVHHPNSAAVAPFLSRAEAQFAKRFDDGLENPNQDLPNKCKLYGIRYEKKTGEVEKPVLGENQMIPSFLFQTPVVYEQSFDFTAERMMSHPDEMIEETISFNGEFDQSVQFDFSRNHDYDYEYNSDNFQTILNEKESKEVKKLFSLVYRLRVYEFKSSDSNAGDKRDIPVAKCKVSEGDKLFAVRIIEACMKCEQGRSLVLNKDEVLALCQMAKDALDKKPVDSIKSGDVRIIGEVRGKFDDLRRALSIPDSDDTEFKVHSIFRKKHVFLGNYLGFDLTNLDTICLLFAMKVFHRKKCVLLRGMTEWRKMNGALSILGELECRFKQDYQTIYDAINDVFDHLPLACTIGENVLCVHGGIVPELKDLEKVKLPVTKLEPDTLPFNLMFGHPNYTVKSYFDNVDLGAGYYFGEEALYRVMQEMKVETIFMSKALSSGFGIFGNQNQLITLCSGYNLERTSVRMCIAVADFDGDLLTIRVAYETGGEKMNCWKKAENEIHAGNQTQEKPAENNSVVKEAKSTGPAKSDAKAKDKQEKSGSKQSAMQKSGVKSTGGGGDGASKPGNARKISSNVGSTDTNTKAKNDASKATPSVATQGPASTNTTVKK